MLNVIRVEPGTKAGLRKRATDDRLGVEKGHAPEILRELTERLSVLHRRLYAEHARSVLLVLQGLDAAGKDGTIRRVFTGLNPQGCVVESFKAPTASEVAHDYLWRIHRVLPERGDIGIFNRSHYEDVVAARAIGVIDDRRRKQRYEHINAFERMLLDEGTSVVKVFLHVGKDEQRARLVVELADSVVSHVRRLPHRIEPDRVRREQREYRVLVVRVRGCDVRLGDGFHVFRSRHGVTLRPPRACVRASR